MKSDSAIVLELDPNIGYVTRSVPSRLVADPFRLEEGGGLPFQPRRYMGENGARPYTRKLNETSRVPDELVTSKERTDA